MGALMAIGHSKGQNAHGLWQIAGQGGVTASTVYSNTKKGSCLVPFLINSRRSRRSPPPCPAICQSPGSNYVPEHALKNHKVQKRLVAVDLPGTSGESPLARGHILASLPSLASPGTSGESPLARGHVLASFDFLGFARD